MRLGLTAIRRLAFSGEGYGLGRKWAFRSDRLGRCAALCSFLLVVLAWIPSASMEIVDRLPRVLILYPYDERIAATTAAGEAVRTRLLDATQGKIDLFSEFLDLSRFPESAHVDRMAQYLSAKYADRRPDVIVALGEQSARFIIANRKQLAENAKIIHAGFSSSTAEKIDLPSDVIGAFTEFDILKTAEMARGLQPEARYLFIIGGSSEFDRWWLATARADLAAFSKDYETTYLEDMTIDEFTKRAAQFPRNSIVLALTIFKDSAGRNFIPREAVLSDRYRRLPALRSTVHIPPTSTTALSVATLSRSSRWALTGGGPGTRCSRPQADLRPRALPRPISQTRGNYSTGGCRRRTFLRAQSRCSGNQPFGSNTGSPWLRHLPSSWHRGSSSVVCLSNASVAGRRRIQSRRRLLEKWFTSISPRQPARCRRRSRTNSTSRWVLSAVTRKRLRSFFDRRGPHLKLIEQILIDIQDDDQRAGDIISRMRGLLKKRSEIDWQEFDLNEVTTSAVQILHGEAERKGVVVSSNRPPRALPVRADKVHVQQVNPNLAINAIDAMLEMVTTERRLVLETTLTKESSRSSCRFPIRAAVSLTNSSPAFSSRSTRQSPPGRALAFPSRAQ